MSIAPQWQDKPFVADQSDSSYRALDCLFDTLKTHGSGFRLEFWDSICTRVLFPIFDVLKTGGEASRFASQEDMSVWLSTTMISALRNLISLYTYYFETLQEFLDGLLDLLCACICQGASSRLLSMACSRVAYAAPLLQRMTRSRA